MEVGERFDVFGGSRGRSLWVRVIARRGVYYLVCGVAIRSII